MDHPPKTQVPLGAPRLLTVREARAFLAARGAARSESQLYKLIKAGALPGNRVGETGRGVLVPEAALEKWCRGEWRTPAEEEALERERTARRRPLRLGPSRRRRAA